MTTLLREQPHQSDSANGASFGWTAVAPKMRLPGPTPDGTERPVGEHRTEHGDADGVHSAFGYREDSVRTPTSEIVF